MMFSAFGQIEECRILRGPDGLSRGGLWVTPCHSAPRSRYTKWSCVSGSVCKGVALGTKAKVLGSIPTGIIMHIPEMYVKCTESHF